MKVHTCLDAIHRFGFISGISIIKYDYRKRSFVLCKGKLLYSLTLGLSTSAVFFFMAYSTKSWTGSNVGPFYLLFSKVIWCITPIVILASLVGKNQKSFSILRDLRKVSCSSELMKTGLNTIKCQVNFSLLITAFYYKVILVIVYFFLFNTNITITPILSVFAYHSASLTILWICIYQLSILNIFNLSMRDTELSVQKSVLNGAFKEFNQLVELFRKTVKSFEVILMWLLIFLINTIISIIFFSNILLKKGFYFDDWFNGLRTYVLFADIPFLIIVFVINQIGRFWNSVSQNGYIHIVLFVVLFFFY